MYYNYTHNICNVFVKNGHNLLPTLLIENKITQQ